MMSARSYVYARIALSGYHHKAIIIQTLARDAHMGQIQNDLSAEQSV